MIQKYKHHQPKQHQSGFTMVELMIAMTVFSVIVIVITVSVIQFSKQYYKGVISSATQNTARTIIDDISRSIEFNAGGVNPISSVPAGPVKGYCVGKDKRYSFEPYQQVTDTGLNAPLQQNFHGLVADSVSCGQTSSPLPVSSLSATLTTTNARELLGQHMRIAKFTIITPSSGELSGKLYVINIKVVYGDNDLLTDPTSPDMTCKSTTGSQFCATAELTTSVRKRLQE